jgi:hypothetical protein
MVHAIDIRFDLPDGIELVSIHSKWHGGWAVCLKVGYDVRDPFGSSLGATYGSGESSTIVGAVQGALARIEGQMLEARTRVPRPNAGIPKPTKTARSSRRDSQFGDMNADQIFAFLASKGGKINA